MKKVLIIDDEDLITRSLLKLLKSKGYSAAVARSSDEAVACVLEEDFNLIVCDVRMPGVDGIDTIKLVRESLVKAGKPKVPEIMITGYADMAKYENAREMDIKDYIYKPFDNEDFMKVVLKHLT